MAFPSGAGAGAGCTWSRQRAPGSTGRQPLYSRLHCGSTTLLSAVSLAPSPPHSSSPALLAAIAEPRAGIRIQLDARPVSMQTHNHLQEPHVAVNAVCGYFLVESRWAGWLCGQRGGLGGGLGRRAPATALPHLGWLLALRLTSGHNSCVSCVRCSTLTLFSFRDGQVQIEKRHLQRSGNSLLMSGKQRAWTRVSNCT